MLTHVNTHTQRKDTTIDGVHSLALPIHTLNSQVQVQIPWRGNWTQPVVPFIPGWRQGDHSSHQSRLYNIVPQNSFADCLPRINLEEVLLYPQGTNIQSKTNFTAVKKMQLCALKSVSLLLSLLLPWLRQKPPHKIGTSSGKLDLHQSRQQRLSSLLLLPPPT
ncbi:hypothetical protein CHARACLAT_028267 [Characodon lateralis]|uniref:Uncharacterized protein n=1 Tax=Characodon lateralis TaxID=208331 RepID=A0ABU7DKG5_9TELE|nr:hypothetical protein [Characodon lateralis]